MQNNDGLGFGHIDVRALRFLSAVLEQRSVTRAGEMMGLSQPAASRLLGQLRRALGDDPLLARMRGGGYVLTARAVQLMPRLVEALAATERLFARTTFDPATSRRTIRIATTDYGVAAVLTRLTHDLSENAPTLSLDIQPLTTDTLDDLEAGRLDLALYTNEPLPSAFRSMMLFAETFACVVRQGHPILRHRDDQGRIAAERLACLPRILMTYVDGSRREVDDPLAVFGGNRPAGTIVTPYFLSSPLLLSGSDHVLCIARRVAELIARAAGLAVVDLPELEGFDYCAIWHARADGDDGVAWIRQRLNLCSS